jgi:hypothetical protein
MKKIQEKSKRYKYQLPIKPSHKDGKHQFPPAKQQSENNRFGENIGQLSLGIDVSHLNISLFNMISQEVVSPLKMSHSLVED